MKKVIKTISIALILVMLCTSLCFANITMISPGNNSIVYGNSFYVSIKISGNSKLRVHVYEEQTYHIGLIEKELEITGRELSDAQGNPVTSLKYKVQGEIYEKYTDVDLLTASDLDLLSSGKKKENGKEIYLSNGQALSYFGEEEYLPEVIYVTANNIGLYTCNYKNFEKGIYRIFAEELNEKGKVVSYASYYIIVKDDDSENDSNKDKAQDESLDEDNPLIIEDKDKKETLFDKITKFLKALFK